MKFDSTRNNVTKLKVYEAKYKIRDTPEESKVIYPFFIINKLIEGG